MKHLRTQILNKVPVRDAGQALASRSQVSELSESRYLEFDWDSGQVPPDVLGLPPPFQPLVSWVCPLRM